MNLLVWIIFMLVAIFAIIPLGYLKVFNSNSRYKYFKYVSILLFVWTIHTWLRLVINQPYFQYYIGLNLYPTVFLVVSVLLIAFLNYLERPLRKWFNIFIAVFFLIELVVVNTNALHQLVWKLLPTSDVTYFTTVNAPNGIFFLIHTAVCYSMLIYIIYLMISYLYKNMKVDRDAFPFFFLLFAIAFGASLNIVHIFLYSFILDPTFITFVLVISIFYFLVFIRDIKLIFIFRNNEFILDNLREMYVAVNQRDEIVDASVEFVKYFELEINKKVKFNDLLAEIISKAVIYTDAKDISSHFDSAKRYLHMQMKTIEIPFYKHTGKFYMFYDETEHQKYINDMNYIKSHDLMTGLFNRNHFEEIKEKIDKGNQSYAIIMFDLDGLKLYNDYLGHDAGDQALINFAFKLQKIAETYNLIPIRMGGDEFVLIAIAMNQKMIDSAMGDIIEVLNSHKGEENILFSYGYAEREAQTEKLERVMSRADHLMYEMKQKNREAKKFLEASLEAKSNKIK